MKFINVENWKTFELGKIFRFEVGKNKSQENLPDGKGYYYLGAKKKSNGVMLECGYDSKLISRGNCIVFICNGQGSVGYTNYMDKDFIATSDLVMGYNKNLNQQIGMFLVTILDLERPKYSFGRKWKIYLKQTKIKLPAKLNSKDEYEPDWQYMENYIKNLSIHFPETKRKEKNTLIDIKNWHDFQIGKIFNLKCGKVSSTEVLSDGDDVYYCGAKKDENGIISKHAYDERYVSSGNCIVFICDGQGAVGYNNYMDRDFIATVNLMLGYNEHLNKYNGLFLVSLLDLERPKFSFGRKRKKTLANTKIKLPARLNEKNEYEPDWNYMENYIKSLPYGDII